MCVNKYYLDTLAEWWYSTSSFRLLNFTTQRKNFPWASLRTLKCCTPSPHFTLKVKIFSSKMPWSSKIDFLYTYTHYTYTVWSTLISCLTWHFGADSTSSSRNQWNSIKNNLSCSRLLFLTSLIWKKFWIWFISRLYPK